MYKQRLEPAILHETDAPTVFISALVQIDRTLKKKKASGCLLPVIRRYLNL